MGEENRKIVLAIRTLRTKLISRSIGRPRSPSPACLPSVKKGRRRKKRHERQQARSRRTVLERPLATCCPPRSSPSFLEPRISQRGGEPEAGRLHVDHFLLRGQELYSVRQQEPILPFLLYPYVRSLSLSFSFSACSHRRSFPGEIFPDVDSGGRGSVGSGMS